MDTYELPVGLWLFTSAEVAESPCSVAKHAKFVMLIEESKQRAQCSGTNDIVATLRTISSDVAKCPHGLLANIKDGGRKEINKLGDSTSFESRGNQV